jgi:hypothetical protein
MSPIPTGSKICPTNIIASGATTSPVRRGATCGFRFTTYQTQSFVESGQGSMPATSNAETGFHSDAAILPVLRRQRHLAEATPLSDLHYGLRVPALGSVKIASQVFIGPGYVEK